MTENDTVELIRSVNKELEDKMEAQSEDLVRLKVTWNDAFQMTFKYIESRREVTASHIILFRTWRDSSQKADH